MGGPTGVQKGAAETAWTPVGAAATNSGSRKGSVSVPVASGRDSCICFDTTGFGAATGSLLGSVSSVAGGLGGVEVIVVCERADASVSPDDGGGAGSGITGAGLSSEEGGACKDASGADLTGSSVARGSSRMIELIRGGRLTSALGTGWADGGAGGGFRSSGRGGESARW